MMTFCAKCKLRGYAERKPQSFWAKLWRWHTKWCPGWKLYQRSLRKAEQNNASDSQ